MKLCRVAAPDQRFMHDRTCTCSTCDINKRIPHLPDSSRFSAARVQQTNQAHPDTSTNDFLQKNCELDKLSPKLYKRRVLKQRNMRRYTHATMNGVYMGIVCASLYI